MRFQDYWSLIRNRITSLSTSLIYVSSHSCSSLIKSCSYERAIVWTLHQFVVQEFYVWNLYARVYILSLLVEYRLVNFDELSLLSGLIDLQLDAVTQFLSDSWVHFHIPSFAFLSKRYRCLLTPFLTSLSTLEYLDIGHHFITSCLRCRVHCNERVLRKLTAHTSILTQVSSHDLKFVTFISAGCVHTFGSVV